MSIPSKAAAQSLPLRARSDFTGMFQGYLGLRVSRASREFQSKKGCLQIGANKTPLVCN